MMVSPSSLTPSFVWYNALPDETRMRKGTFLFGILLIWGGALLASVLAASQKPTAVSLGDVSSLPDTQVMVPLYFTPNPPETKAGRLSATIRFENQRVRFLRAEKGIVLESIQGTVAVKEESDTGNAQQSVLRMEIAAGGEERLREGVLLFLTFAIKADAPAGTTVTLQLQDLQAGSLEAPARAIEPLAAKNGTIQVIKPEEVPYTSCFFFTH